MNYKDSEFYKNKNKQQIENFKKVCLALPDYAVNALKAKEFQIAYSSLIEYGRDLLTFFRYLKNNNPTLSEVETNAISVDILCNLSEEDFLEYQSYLRLTNVDGVERTNNNKSIARKMTSLRNLYSYLKRKDYIENNILADLPIPKYSNRKTEIIRLHSEPENNELQAFLIGLEEILYSDRLSEHQKQFIARDITRDTALLYLLLGTGIRVSECEGLDVSDVDLDTRCIRIKRKGGFFDVVYFNNDVKEKLEYYISTERTKEMINKYGPALFLSAHKKRITVDAIRDITEKYTLIICNKRLSPHKLRASYGTLLYSETKDIRLTADVLGHTNINTTVRYAAQLEENKRRAGSISLSKAD